MTHPACLMCDEGENGCSHLQTGDLESCPQVIDYPHAKERGDILFCPNCRQEVYISLGYDERIVRHQGHHGFYRAQYTECQQCLIRWNTAAQRQQNLRARDQVVAELEDKRKGMS